MSRRRSFVTVTLNPEKSRIATKITWLILLRNIKTNISFQEQILWSKLIGNIWMWNIIPEIASCKIDKNKLIGR